jgi:hypothetical protein
VGGFVDEDAAPTTFAAIDTSVVEVVAGASLEAVWAISTPSRLCSGGLKRPKSSVNTVNALPIAASTTTECRMLAEGS